MLIFDDVKLIYLANPKTGTTAFELAFRRHANEDLSNALPKHVSYGRVRRKFPELAETHEAITCVRDPLETLYSWYRYRQRATMLNFERSTANVSFTEFIEEWCKDEPQEFAQVNAGSTFVMNKKGKVPRKLRLFRYDASPSIIDYVSAKRGEKIAVKKKNVSPAPKPEEFEAVRTSSLMQNEKLIVEYRKFESLNFVNDGSTGDGV